MTTLHWFAYIFGWVAYAGALYTLTRRYERQVERVDAALRELANPDELRMRSWALVAENDRLRIELASKDHHLAAMQARIEGLEGRKPS